MARIVRGLQDPISNERLHGAGEAPVARFDDLGFPCDYACEAAPATREGLDGALVVPSQLMRGQCEGLFVRVAPKEGQAWTAVFFGDYSFDGFPEGAFGTPDPDRLLVLAGGVAHLVPASGPAGLETLAFCVSGLAADAGLGVLAITDHDMVYGLRTGGGTWETPRLSMCCLRLRTVDGPFLRGDAVNTWSKDVPFEVDLRDGSWKGGWEGA